MDIIEASECLRAWCGQSARKTFDDEAIGTMEGELPASSEEGKEAEDSSSYNDGDGENGLKYWIWEGQTMTVMRRIAL